MADEARSIYNHEQKYSRGLEGIEKWPTSERNKEILKDFFVLCAAQKLTDARKFKFICLLKRIVTWLSVDFDKVTKDDLIEVMGSVRKQNFKLQTERDYQIVIKKLYKTLTSTDKYSHLDPIYAWLYDHRRNEYYKTTLDRKKLRDTEIEEYFTEQEVLSLIDKASSLRDKCFFTLMALYGTRPSEALNIKIKDIYKYDHGLKIIVAGKTGLRTLYVITGAAAFTNYLEIHEEKDNREAYLFPFGVARAKQIIKMTALKAGIEKNVFLYKLRKFCITHDRGQGLSNQACELKFGWVKGSGMFGIYDKSKDYREEVERMHGLTKNETVSILKDRNCPRCKEINTFDAKYCKKCSTPMNLSEKDILEEQTSKKRIVDEQSKPLRELLAQLLDDPIVLERAKALSKAL